MSGDFWLSWWYRTFILMSFLGLDVWVVNWHFLSGRNRKLGTKGAPERRLGDYCPDMMKGGKKQHVYNPCRGGEQHILTQQVRMLLCCCGQCWKWGQRSTTHQLWWLQRPEGPLRSALRETLAYFPAVHSWFCRVHSAQSAQSLVVTLARGTRAVYRHSLSTHRQQCKPDRLAIFHTATVTGSQNTWVIYSLLAAQSQAWCFPNNMKTLISPYRTKSKIEKILLEQW